MKTAAGSSPQLLSVLFGREPGAFFEDTEEIFDVIVSDGRRERRILLMNYNDQPESIDLFVQCPNHPVVWDTLSGKIEEADVVEQAAEGVVIRLTLPCSHGIVVTASL